MLLKSAYIEERYNKDYNIAKREPEDLAGQVRKLQRITSKVCKDKIRGF